MAIVTHLYAKSEKNSVSQELHDYFSDLMQSLATKVCLEQNVSKTKRKNNHKV